MSPPSAPGPIVASQIRPTSVHLASQPVEGATAYRLIVGGRVWQESDVPVFRPDLVPATDYIFTIIAGNASGVFGLPSRSLAVSTPGVEPTD